MSETFYIEAAIALDTNPLTDKPQFALFVANYLSRNEGFEFTGIEIVDGDAGIVNLTVDGEDTANRVELAARRSGTNVYERMEIIGDHMFTLWIEYP